MCHTLTLFALERRSCYAWSHSCKLVNLNSPQNVVTKILAGSNKNLTLDQLCSLKLETCGSNLNKNFKSVASLSSGKYVVKLASLCAQLG